VHIEKATAISVATKVGAFNRWTFSLCASLIGWFGLTNFRRWNIKSAAVTPPASPARPLPLLHIDIATPVSSFSLFRMNIHQAA